MQRAEAIAVLVKELGVKPEGNMVWFMDSETPPRQLTKVERKLFAYIIKGLQESKQ